MYLRRTSNSFNIEVPAGTDPNSAAVKTEHYVWGSFMLPAALGSTIKFQVSNDGTNWFDAVDDSNTALSTIDSSAGKHVVIPVSCFTAMQFRIAVTGTVTATSLPTKLYS